VVVGAFAANCWLYPLDSGETPPEQGRPCAVIDPGAEANIIIARMEKLNLSPRYILFTHGHFDHVAGLPALAARIADLYGVPAEIAIHGDDASYLGPGAYQVHRESFAAIGDSSYIDQLWEPLPPADRLLSEGDALGPFRVLHLPGHTPGSAGFYDEKAGVLFTGDTLFRDGVGRTDLPGGDSRTLAASLQRLFTLPGNTVFYPGHGPAGILEEERLHYRFR
jgi:glyoxylase-like metal-dependent hydrolase (beta-lactamase superfamily II)